MKKQKQEGQSLHFVNVFVTLLILAVVGCLALLLPKPTVSEIEKRELAKRPQWSWSSWFSGEFAKEYDAYFADTFPARDELVTAAVRMESMRGLHPDDVRIHQAAPQPKEDTLTAAVGAQETPKQEPSKQNSSSKPQADPSASKQKTPEKQIDYDAYQDPNAPGNGLSGEGDGEQIEGLFLYQNMGMQIFGGSQTMAERYANTINSYTNALDGVQVYSMVIPTPIEFYLPPKYQGISPNQKENIEFINSHLLPQVKRVDAYSEIEKQKDDYLYFRTDHHWTARGAYAAYLAFCRSAGLEPVALSEMERHQIDGFLGTYYNQTQDLKLAKTPDFVEYFVPPVKCQTWQYRRGKPFDPVESTIFASYATGGQNTYGVFLHGDYPLTHIKTDNKTGRKILMTKESFGNAFAPFLVSHFDEVFVVDQRYFELNLTDFIREHGVTDLIFVNNIFAANTKIRIEELERIQNQTYVPYVPATPAPVQQETPAQPEVKPEAEPEVEPEVEPKVQPKSDEQKKEDTDSQQKKKRKVVKKSQKESAKSED